MNTERDDDPNEQYRSASMNAALGIAAASPFLHAAAQAAKEKLTGGEEEPPPPKVELPPGADRQ